MLRLKGVTQHYSWGDRFALPTLLDITADGRPWAEVWYGTHPRGPAQIDESLHLPAPTYLADEVGELPFIVKLLAAARPLSLQTHPSNEQAVAGFAREQRAGIAPDDRRRVYPDDRAKPEMIVALSTFEALCGFVDDEAAIIACAEAGATDLAARVRSEGVAGAARAILRGETFTEPTRRSDAMRTIDDHYHDRRSLIALLMHHVQLQPGEALYLDAGNVHTYLYGMALEVQGSSDNVVRAAFTDKHIDLDEFLAVARFDAINDPRVMPERLSAETSAYRCTAPFEVLRHELNGAFTLTANRSHTMVVCTSGRAGSLTTGAAAYVARGETVTLDGTATIYSVSA